MIVEKNAVIFEAQSPPYRWLGAVGDVQQFELQNGFPVDDTTGDPTQFNMTVVEVGTGNTVVTNSVSDGYKMLITNAANDFDGINLQLKGEGFKLVSGKKLYFGTKLKVSDADNIDLLVGLAETDTALLATATTHGTDYGTTDLIGFLSLDGTAVVSSQAVLAGVVTGSGNSANALADDTAITLEMYWDGSTLFFYVNEDLVNCVNSGLPDGELTPTINFRNGEATANTCEIAWLACRKIN